MDIEDLMDEIPSGSSRSRKRKGGSGRVLTAGEKGMHAQIKFSKSYPWSEYGAMRVKRGTPDNLARFGQTWKEASEEQRAARKAAAYTGRGRYYGKVLGGMAGRFLGSRVGLGGLGGAVGAAAGDYLTGRGLYAGRGLYTGRGAYSAGMRMNELMAGSENSPPRFQSAGDEAGALVVSHREYVGDIFAPASAVVSDFTVQSFPLNPGLEQTFPWLSQIAQNYEEYEMKQCVFEFVSTVQDINSANGQVGTIITATQYNPSKPDFQDKPAMAAYAHAVSGKSTDNQTHGVECDPSKLSGSEGKYVRANPVLTGEDLKTYDHGRFQLATHNIPAAMASGTLGELYVSYTIVLRKPKFFTGRGLGLTRFMEVADATQGASLTNTRLFGNDGQELTARQNNLKIKTEKTDNTLKITFPAYYGGRLRVMIACEGSSLASSDFFPGNPVVAGNVSLVADLYAAGSSGSDNPDTKISSPGGTVNRIFALYSINVEPATNATDNTLTITTAVSSGSVNQSYLDIQEYQSFGALAEPQLVNAAGTAVTL